MIERLRRGAQSGLSYILIGVLIVFFAVFFGVPADGCMAGDGQRSLMASVDGEDIYTEDVNIIQNRMFAQRSGSRQLDEEFFSRQAESLRIVIAIHALANRAEEAGLRVSDEEFRQYMTDPARNFEFQVAYGRTGQFDGDFYERYVEGRLRTPITSYEEFKRRELLARKYLSMLDMHAHVSTDEIQELHQLRDTRVNLEYVRFDQDSLIDVVGLDDEDIEQFLASDEGMQQVEEYYEANRADYEEPEEVQLRTIQIFKDDDEDADAANRFDEARTRVVDDGEDFATVAQELSEDFYREDGGLMDWNTLDNVDSAIAEAIEGADVGEIRETESDHAFTLVKVEDRRDEQVEPLEAVQHDIAEQLLRRDVVETRGVELAETLHQRLTADVSLQQALEQLEQEAREEERDEDAEIWASLSADTTGFFTLEEEQQFPMMQQPGFDMSQFASPWYEIPGIGEHQQLAVAAFRATEDDPLIDEIFEVEDARVVARLAEREQPEELTAEERAELEFEVQSEKADELIGNWRMFFIQPTEELPTYIEAVLQEDMEDGSIRLFERNSRAAALVRTMLEGVDDVAVEEVIDLPEDQQPEMPDFSPDDDEE